MKNNCSIYKAAEIIGKNWTLLVLMELYKNKGRLRYSGLKRSIPDISPKILSQRLKELEKDKIIKKTIDNSNVPIKTYYELTISGQGLMKIIIQLKKWVLKFKSDNFVCKGTDCINCKL